MAVVKIRKVKATLAKSIAYVTDPAKTDGQRLASTTTGHDIADCDAIAAAFLNDLESTKGGSARKGPAACHPYSLKRPEQRRAHERDYRSAGNRHTGAFRE